MRDLDIRGAGDLLGADQSGFINEIGFETYQKILNEAIEELKEEEFQDLFETEKEKFYVKDCHLETDLEVLIPETYVSNIEERLNLYKELNQLICEEMADFSMPTDPGNELLTRDYYLSENRQKNSIEIKNHWLQHRRNLNKFISIDEPSPFCFLAVDRSVNVTYG